MLIEEIETYDAVGVYVGVVGYRVGLVANEDYFGGLINNIASQISVAVFKSQV